MASVKKTETKPKEKSISINKEIEIMQSHLQELRNLAGWSADELGQKLGMSRQAINALERGGTSTDKIGTIRMNQLHYLALIHLFTSECENSSNEALAAVLKMLFEDPDNYLKNKDDYDIKIEMLASPSKKSVTTEEANNNTSKRLKQLGLTAIIPVIGIAGLSALLTRKILKIGKKEK